MKIKTVVITVAVIAAAAAGIGYGVQYSMKSQVKPVDVVPVVNVNYTYWGDSSSMYGTIVSQDSQNVQLNSDYDLVKVYVQTGDQVKVGDPLLEYDMTLKELEKEMEDLTKQSLELNLTAMQKELEKLQNTRPSASLDLNEGTMTASDEEGLFEDPSAQNGDFNGAAGVLEMPASSGDDAGSGLIEEGGDTAGGTGGETGTAPSQEIPDGGEAGAEPLPSGNEDTGEEAGDSILEDLSPEPDTEEGTLYPEDNVLIDEDSPEIGEEVSDPEAVITAINEFLTRVNQMSAQELDELIPSDISEALRIYRENLSTAEEVEITDAFGEQRIKTTYTLRPEVAQLVGESTAQVLVQAYDRACVYHLIYCVNQIDSENRTAEDLEDEMIRSLEEKIRLAADAYYGLQKTALESDEYKETLEAYTERLGGFIARLNRMDVLEETEASTEDMTEFPGDYGDFGDFGDLGDGLSYTADELKEMIQEQKQEIEETELQIRESELKLKQYQRELDNKIVKSNMNGVVKSAGTLEDSVSDENFIVITGSSGMYVRGTIHELKLDTVSVGDMVQGTSYDTGMSFTASITEISPYPVSSNNYWSGEDNSNASYYPFLAYIEEDEGLTEGDVELQFVSNVSSSKIYLEKYFIREDVDGRDYVYLQGSDGLLKKQYVKTGITIYGMAIEIKSGVSMTDKIAFPYGKNVVEGAATNEVDNLESNYGYYGVG